MRTTRMTWLTLCVATVLALTGHDPATAAVVLFMSTGNDAEDAQVQATLESFGHQVDIGPQYINFDDTIGLSVYDAVLLLPNFNYSGGDMPIAGQNALIAFVDAGGGLVTGEWLVWKQGAQGTLASLSEAIPVIPTSSYSGGSPITYSVETPDPILNDGVDSSFTFAADNIGGGTETFFAPKDGATVFYSSSGAAGGAGVIGWVFGDGAVISFSTNMGSNELNDSNYSQLLSNAIVLVSPSSPR